MHLLGLIVKDPAFYALAGEGTDVEVDVAARLVRVHVPNSTEAPPSFPFTLTTMEERFLQAGGVEKLYRQFRKQLFRALVKGPQAPKPLTGGGCGDDDCGSTSGIGSEKLAW